MSRIVEITSALTLAIVVVVGLLLLVRRLTGRKHIIFDEWIDLRPAPEESLGRSVGAMVVHRVRAIHRLHERSVERVEISKSSDIPTFAEGLDDDLELLSSVRLGTTPAAVAALLVFMVQAFPFLARRTRLSGSIHLHGSCRRLQAVLENYQDPRTGVRCTRLWEVIGKDAEDTSIPDDIEELAYRIYLDLVPDDGFKSWRCFREFTLGLEHHVDHMDLGHDADRDQAIEHYENALRIEEGNQAVSYNLGVIQYMRYSSTESNDAAMNLFRVGLTARNNDLRARANSAMANALLTQVHRFGKGGRPELEEALLLAEQALELQPDLDVAAKASGYAHHQLGEWLHRHGNGDERAALALHHRRCARRGYERAIKLNPLHYVAANNMANLLLEWAKIAESEAKRMDLLDDAATACERSLQVNPTYNHGHDNMGNIRLEQGDYEGALRSFRTALRFQPSYPEARNDIAVVHLDIRFPSATAEDACVEHLAALDLTNERSAEQREKLCRQFTSKAKALDGKGFLVEGFARALPTAKACSCSRLRSEAEVR